MNKKKLLLIGLHLLIIIIVLITHFNVWFPKKWDKETVTKKEEPQKVKKFLKVNMIVIKMVLTILLTF